MSEQPAPVNGHGDVWLELLDALPGHPLEAAMRDRRQLGIERYGVPLGRGDGRDAARDLREELLDAAVYVQRLYGRPGQAHPVAVMLLQLVTLLGVE